MRYNSLVVDVPPVGFRVVGWDPDGEILAMWDPRRGLLGVQYHPESILSEYTRPFFEGVRRWVIQWKSKFGQRVRGRFEP